MAHKTKTNSGIEGSGAPPSRPGRVYPRKTDIVLKAAEKAFLKAGFALASMDDVAELAGVSKRTVYSNFGSKDELFAQVILKRCAELLPDPAVFAKAAAASPADGLAMLATTFLKNIFARRQIELYQTAAAAALRRPEIGKIIFYGPIMRTQHLFADYLRGQVKAGRLVLSDPDLAAAQLMALLQSNLHMKLVLNQAARIGPKTIESSVAASVELFLHGAMPRPKLRPKVAPRG